MQSAELLTVSDSFQIEGRGVVIIPDFSVPNEWQNRAETVVVIKPDGQQFEARAELSMAHFSIRDPKAPFDKRWRVVVSLPGMKKEDLPVGSKILVPLEIRDALFSPQR